MEVGDQSLNVSGSSKGPESSTGTELPRIEEVLPKEFIEGVREQGIGFLKQGYFRFEELTVGNSEAEQLMKEWVVECAKRGEGKWSAFKLDDDGLNLLRKDYIKLNGKADDLYKKYPGKYKSISIAREDVLIDESGRNFNGYNNRGVLNLIGPKKKEGMPFGKPPEYVRWAEFDPQSGQVSLTAYGLERIGKAAQNWMGVKRGEWDEMAEEGG